MSLIIPSGDFDFLPQKLGCSLHRGPARFELATESEGCFVVFEVDGELASLTHLAIHDDPEGRFMRDVVVPLMVSYQGTLDASLQWTPGQEESHLLILEGETTHSLLSVKTVDPAEPSEKSLELVEEWLDAGKRAWREYRALKGQSEPDHQ